MSKPKDPLAVELGRRGGKKRVSQMTKKERSESARKAAEVRWTRYREEKLKKKQQEKS